MRRGLSVAIIASWRPSIESRVAEERCGNRRIISASSLNLRGPVNRHIIIALCSLTFVVSGATYAQQGGTEKERRACAGSVQRYCRSAIPQGEFAVLGCLQQNRGKLTTACRKVLADHGQ
jgi:hypothetical protein